MAFAALVDDAYLHFAVEVRVVIALNKQPLLGPLEAVAVDEGGPGDRRYHRVAVEVLHVTHGDVNGLFVDLVVAVEDIDHQLVVVERPVEVQFLQETVRLDRCIERAVGHALVGQVSDEWNDLVDHLTRSGVDELAFVVTGEALFEYAVRVEELLLEGQVTHQAHLVAGEGDILVGLDKRLGQCLLEDGELVDVALESVAA